MQVITAIYLNCRPDLRDEWLSGNEVDDLTEAQVTVGSWATLSLYSWNWQGQEHALRHLVKFCEFHLHDRKQTTMTHFAQTITNGMARSAANFRKHIITGR